MKERGFSLVETTVALAVLGLLASVGAAGLGTARLGLGLLPLELKGALDQAGLLARARGVPVRVALGGPGGEVAPVVLPRGVRWGLPRGAVAMPPGMEDPVRVHLTGQAHPVISVTPWGTATASAWFVTDGQDALCLRLSGLGRLQILRWRQARQTWVRL